MQNLFIEFLTWVSYYPIVGLVILITAFWIVIKVLGHLIFGSTLRAARAAESKES